MRLPFAVVALVTATLALAQPPAKKVALLVGVNVYKDTQRLPALRFAEADVASLDKLLRDAGYKVTLLTGSATAAERKPTKANIEAKLAEVLRGCDPGDTAVVAFAGHGMQFTGQTDAYFCPPEARPFADETVTMVSLTKVYDELKKSFAGVKVLFVDACRNDPDPSRGARGGVTADLAPPPPHGVAALFSCKAGERAFEHETLGHGIFFHHVLEGLKGEAADRRGVVTFGGLSSYVAHEVADGEQSVAKLIGGVRQSPNTRADFSGVPVLLKVVVAPGTAKIDAAPPAGESKLMPKSKAMPPASDKTLTLDLGGGVTMEFMQIPAGDFLRGAPDGETDASNDEKPQKRITIANDFYLAKYETTQEQYRALTGASPSWFSAGGGGKDTVGNMDTSRFPVEQVTHADALAFCAKLKAKTGRNATLPTEAQWEYACRARTTTPFHFGTSLNGDKANCDGNSPYGTTTKGNYLERTCAVGQYAANDFGLADMHGNVWEWCLDWYDEGYYKASATVDPICTTGEQKYRVLRGGSWYVTAGRCRAACRALNDAANRRCGFRVAFRLD